jgi:hypothetical protein
MDFNNCEYLTVPLKGNIWIRMQLESYKNSRLFIPVSFSCASHKLSLRYTEMIYRVNNKNTINVVFIMRNIMFSSMRTKVEHYSYLSNTACKILINAN